VKHLESAVKREPETADDVEQLRVPLARALRAAMAWPKLAPGTQGFAPGGTGKKRKKGGPWGLIKTR